MPNRINRRVASRESVFLRGVATGLTAAEPSVHRVRNISAGGACIDGAGHLKVGQTLLLDIGRLEEIAATTVWVRDELAGLRFAKDIDPLDAKTRGQASPPRGKFSQG